MTRSRPSSITFRNIKMSAADVASLMRNLNRHDIPLSSKRCSVCPKCEHVLSIGEVVEKYCIACGDIEPSEVRS